MKVNIVIPMAGRGSRFANVGFVQPKPLIDVAGKHMISWVVDNVDSSAIDAHFIFLVLKEHEDKFNLSAELKKLKQNVSVVLVDQVTEGAACTVLLSRVLIDNETPLFIANSDQFVEWSADAYWSTLAADKSDGDVLCFKIPMEKNDTKWSYAKIDSEGHVTDIQEKVVISENATVGYYYWKRGCDYVRLADQMIAKNIRVNGEFYVAPVYNEGVLEGMKYKLSFCDKMWGLGVPHDLTSFLTNYVRPRLPARATNTSPARGPMRFIAHRGNLYGADPVNENKPEHLRRALDLGYDIELDVRYFPDKDEWWLGHDEPQYQVPFEFLLQDRLWIHCKNGAALQRLAKDERVNCFFHDVDDFVLTSKDYIWIYPEKPLQGPTSIAVMFKDSAALLDKDIFGICSDDVGLLRQQYVAMHSPSEAGPAIELVIFDLDGVLVESKDLHYDALNRAIEEVAGAEFVIKRAEHESVYDGLSTNQKLRLMTISKGLPLELHKPVWVRKQELTDELVREQLKPSAELLASLKALKQAGYPVAVASNCIKSSVHNILDSIGALPLVDAYLSNEDVKHPKPDPDIYLKACSVFGVAPACAIVVEDSPKGFESSIRAGCNLFKVKGPHEVVSDVILDHIGALNASVKPITVVVPLAAPSQQYWIDGPESVPCEIPSFLADANGSPAIRWVVEPILKSRYALKFVFIVKESQMTKFKLSSLLPRIVDFRPTVVVPVHGETLGALKTVLLASDAIDADAPVLLVTCSNVTTWMPGGMSRFCGLQLRCFFIL
jgi:HAD superfamily hydrolase (TIGR01509 family)